MKTPLQIKPWLPLALITALTIGCTSSNTTTSQPADSPVAQSSPTEVTASPTPETVAQADAGAALKSGSFVSGEHPTEGTVRILDQNGSLVLELDESFKTSEMGPDLVVALHRSPDVIGSTTPPAYAINEGDYVVIAPLQQFDGAQTYVIPDSINLNDYQSALIWCRKFNATFGAATLQ
ncbi:DM13 domain-containing protein [Oscillatoria sp. FACHB-1407]|uniref:DM13 domain-containing protein n=1 Tax=Oscillatoria sp. FACHB-1407 TaxID=2692847 RepID=UPI001687F188|nr:DM13 domain-containing protein [Oscillatoria sp. FACHB-1407]MBD2461530.1 DM13 domain-containing protein [Oscillatoria sp. FACHB-1407]